jgi:hypothetical protein
VLRHILLLDRDTIARLYSPELTDVCTSLFSFTTPVAVPELARRQSDKFPALRIHNYLIQPQKYVHMLVFLVWGVRWLRSFSPSTFAGWPANAPGRRFSNAGDACGTITSPPDSHNRIRMNVWFQPYASTYYYEYIKFRPAPSLVSPCQICGCNTKRHVAIAVTSPYKSSTLSFTAWQDRQA